MSGLEQINETLVETKLRFLAETDETFAQLSGAVHAQKDRLRLVKARAFLSASGTVAERTAIAEGCEETERAIEDGQNARVDYELLASQRDRADKVIEIWRSLNASRRKN